MFPPEKSGALPKWSDYSTVYAIGQVPYVKPTMYLSYDPIYYRLFVALTLLLTLALGYGTFATARLLRRWRPDRNLLLTPVENLMRVVLVAACIILGLLSGQPAAQLGWRLPTGWLREVMLGAIVGAALGMMLFVMVRLLLRRAARRGDTVDVRLYSDVLARSIIPRSKRDYMLVALAMAGVVVLEELLFRSLLIGGLLPLAPAWLLLLIWSTVFGLLHSPQGTWAIIATGAAGALLGVLFLWRGTLLTPIVAHYATNMVQLEIARRQSPSTQAPPDSVYPAEP